MHKYHFTNGKCTVSTRVNYFIVVVVVKEIMNEFLLLVCHFYPPILFVSYSYRERKIKMHLQGTLLA